MAVGQLRDCHVSILRSSLLMAIVSVLVLTGYSHAVMDRCCAGETQEQADHETPVHGNDGGCECLCHKVFSNDSAKPVRLPGLVLVLQAARWSADEFPPDAEPQGIEHPPQIG